MKNIFLLLTLLLEILVFPSCKKQDPSFTPDDQGTFEARINNIQLLPCLITPINGGPITTSFLQFSSTHYTISASAKNACDEYYPHDRFVNIHFDSIQIEENRTYKLGNGNNVINGQVRCLYYQSSTKFVSDSTLAGTITVTKFNPISRILAASFEGTLKDLSGQTISLTQGKFDLKY